MPPTLYTQVFIFEKQGDFLNCTPRMKNAGSKREKLEYYLRNLPTNYSQNPKSAVMEQAELGGSQQPQLSARK